MFFLKTPHRNSSVGSWLCPTVEAATHTGCGTPALPTDKVWCDLTTLECLCWFLWQYNNPLLFVVSSLTSP